ncbi:MAG TPA: bifunctional UDP-N-acetylglucosamine diphosphorylase/glucosamine-1-phosphate N-acetyltransferase GlmU [Stellaceae bacterium]|jgi:bifunctional UDP-N-acetylglucosamine pyrophosphorylase/glucosamine-1-phosphate N-acetyltransferase
MSRNRFAAIILAAGEGTRMHSKKPKVLHEVAGRAMIAHVLDAVGALDPAETIVVLAPGMDAVAKAVAPATVAIQVEARGTGHAVQAAETALTAAVDTVLVLFGDTPLVCAETLERLLAARKGGAAVVIAGMRPADPSPYGRLVEDGEGIARIVEAKDATPEEFAIDLCNGGIMAIDARRAFDLVGRIGCDNAKAEYYLTDIVALARADGLRCTVVEMPAEDVLGVNTRAELAAAEAIMQQRLRARAMANGATLIAPETVFLSADTVLGRDVIVEPNVVFGAGVSVGDDALIRSFSHLDRATIGTGAIVGPFARLRPGAILEEDVHVGNFVEVKATRIRAGAKANHLAYLGDSDIGARTNIGAGTITCNYDGFNKHRTMIGAGTFIGSNATLVAPISVGDGAFVAAGSIVTRDVPADALTIGRGSQVDKPGRAVELRAKLKGSGR